MEEITYDEFIQNILNIRGQHGCGQEYHENHHIIPRCIGGTDDENNLIDLFAREHFIAHKLLAKENPSNKKLIYAWWMMSHIGRVKITAEEYEEAKLAFVKIQKEYVASEETRKKISDNHADIKGEKNPFFGKKHTEEVRKKISQKAKDRCKDRSKIPTFGKKSLTKNNTTQKEDNPNFIKVVRLMDEKIYDCMKSCYEENSMDKKTLRNRCKSHNGFMFYDEYVDLKSNNQELLNTYIEQSDYRKWAHGEQNHNAQKIVRLIDGKIYNCMKDAAKDNSISYHTILRRCYNDKDFMYYDKWLVLKNKQGENNIEI